VARSARASPRPRSMTRGAADRAERDPLDQASAVLAVAIPHLRPVPPRSAGGRPSIVTVTTETARPAQDGIESRRSCVTSATGGDQWGERDGWDRATTESRDHDRFRWHSVWTVWTPYCHERGSGPAPPRGRRRAPARARRLRMAGQTRATARHRRVADGAARGDLGPARAPHPHRGAGAGRARVPGAGTGGSAELIIRGCRRGSPPRRGRTRGAAGRRGEGCAPSPPPPAEWARGRRRRRGRRTGGPSSGRTPRRSPPCR
jgi:hypothetical protein